MVPSKIFPQTKWDITDSICEQGPTLGDRNASVDNSCLIQKGILFV